MASIEEAISSAVEAIDRGDLGQGRTTLSWVVREDPDNRLAWVWLAACVDDDSARDECYRKASEIPQFSNS
jgi:Tfp pilus assembly protein PilF